jgi:PAS domain S-box-containing protein
VSERKRSEQALLDSERHHRTILNTVSEAIFYCNSALKLQFVNPAWTDMTGHGLGTGKSDSLLDYTHPEDIQRVLQARERASGGESSVREELRLRDKGCVWRRVDLVLLDLHMPVMDGLEAAVQIGETPAGAKVRIVAVSADVTTDSRQAANYAGFDDWLPKPFTRDALESLTKKLAF